MLRNREIFSHDGRAPILNREPNRSDVYVGGVGQLRPFCTQHGQAMVFDE